MRRGRDLNNKGRRKGIINIKVGEGIKKDNPLSTIEKKGRGEGGFFFQRNDPPPPPLPVLFVYLGSLYPFL